MKYLNTVIFSLLVCVASAQPTINFDLHQSIGSEWGIGILKDIPIGDFPEPLAGTDIIWDYTFIGDLDNGFGVTFSQADLDDFLLSTFLEIENLPLIGGGTVQDSFPNGVGVLFEGAPDDRDGYILVQNEGIERIGEIYDNAGAFGIDEKNSFLIYPFDIGYGDFIRISSLKGYIEPNSIDSLITIDTFAYVGYGTMKMYYGDVSNVVLYKKIRKETYRSYDLVTGGLIHESNDYRTAYFFLQNGNLLPLAYYSFSANPDWTPLTDNMNVKVFVYVPFSPIIDNVEDETALPFGLTLSPNPASERVAVSYVLEKAMAVSMVLYAADGRKVAGKTSVRHSAGIQADEFLLPNYLPPGTYFLRLTAGAKMGFGKIIIQK